MDIFKSIGVLAIAIVVGFGAYVAGQHLGNAPVSPDSPNPGSITSPDLPYNYIGVGGIETYTYQMALVAPTTTPCTILSPAGTTTLEIFTFNVTTGTSTAGLITLATSTVPNATTSLITTKTIGASTLGTMQWHGGSDNSLVSPNTYLVAGVANAPTPGFTYIGSCSATFRTVN